MISRPQTSAAAVGVGVSMTDATRPVLIRALIHLGDNTKASVAEDVSTEFQIVASAVELFASRGYQATSMRDIAEKVGIKAASIYAHFPGKSAVLEQALRRVLNEFFAFATEPLDPDQSAAEAIEILVRRHALFKLQNPSILSAWHVLVDVDRMNAILDPEARNAVMAHRELFHELENALVLQAFPGITRSDDRLRAVRTLCGRVDTWCTTADADEDATLDFVWSLARAIFVSDSI